MFQQRRGGTWNNRWSGGLSHLGSYISGLYAARYHPRGAYLSKVGSKLSQKGPPCHLGCMLYAAAGHSQPPGTEGSRPAGRQRCPFQPFSRPFWPFFVGDGPRDDRVPCWASAREPGFTCVGVALAASRWPRRVVLSVMHRRGEAAFAHPTCRPRGRSLEARGEPDEAVRGRNGRDSAVAQAWLGRHLDAATRLVPPCPAVGCDTSTRPASWAFTHLGAPWPSRRR